MAIASAADARAKEDAETENTKSVCRSGNSCSFPVSIPSRFSPRRPDIGPEKPAAYFVFRRLVFAWPGRQKTSAIAMTTTMRIHIHIAFPFGSGKC